MAIGNYSTNEIRMPRRQLSDTEECSAYFQFTEPIKDPLRYEPDTFFLNTWIGA